MSALTWCPVCGGTGVQTVEEPGAPCVGCKGSGKVVGSSLPRTTHADRAKASGRFKASPPCDGCGKPVGTAYYTDDDVCGGSDGPGFYLCERKLCRSQFLGMTVEQRRDHYIRVRSVRRVSP